MIRRWTFVLAIALGVNLAAAATPDCDRLDDRERQLAERILASEHLYDCCDATISECLAAQPPCPLAVRIADNVCRRVAAGQDERGIRHALSRRARSMIGGGAPAEVDLGAAPILGPEDAPVTVTIYACARCPYCSKLVPELVRATRTPPLDHEIRFVFRIFPIRGHPGSTAAGLGFAAAAEMGRFWPFMLYAYDHFDEFSPELQPGWAAAVGLDPESFETLMADPKTREALVASKKEGLVNHVESTPTLFINGRRWVGDLTADELLDAFAEEADRVGPSTD